MLSRVDKSTMMRMLRDEPNFSEVFTAHLLSRTLRVEEGASVQNCSSQKLICGQNCALRNFYFVVFHAERHPTMRNGLRGLRCSLCSPTAETCSFMKWLT